MRMMGNSLFLGNYADFSKDFPGQTALGTPW